MKRVATLSVTMLWVAGALLAQTTRESTVVQSGVPDSKNQNWKVTLVDASCMAPGMTKSASTTTSTREYQQEENAADRSADRSSDPTVSSSSSSKSTSSVHETTTTEVDRQATVGNHHVHAKKLDRSCGITDQTAAYAVLLRGGLLVRLDEPSNTKITAELKGNSNLRQAVSSSYALAAADNGRVYEVKVNGEIVQSMMHVDSIRK